MQPTGDAVAALAYDPCTLDTVKVFNCAAPTPTPIVVCANDVPVNTEYIGKP